MDLWRFNAKVENTKFGISIRNRLQQVKGQSSNRKSKYNFLHNTFTIK